MKTNLKNYVALFFALLAVNTDTKMAQGAPVIQWQRSFGGSGNDRLYSIQQTSDGGYVLGGDSQSGISGNKTSTHGYEDYWIIKLDANGNKIWEKSFGGSVWDYVSNPQQTSDGGIS